MPPSTDWEDSLLFLYKELICLSLRGSAHLGAAMKLKNTFRKKYQNYEMKIIEFKINIVR